MPIRPLERADLPAAAALFRRTIHADSGQAGIERLFEALLFDDPWSDPELPSLASVDGDGRLVGLFSRCTRRFLLDGEPVRIAMPIHFCVDPEARGRAVAALLAARLLGGPQDASHTDGADLPTRKLWGAMKGHALQLESLEWTRVLRPASYWQDRVVGRRGSERLTAAARRLAAPFDGVAARAAGEPADGLPAGVTDAPLTPAALVGALDAVSGWARLRPAYDEPFAAWLLEQLAQTTSYGRLSARIVTRDGEVLGWHVGLVEPHGVAEALQIAARPEASELVFDAFLANARGLGAVAARGRLEAPLTDAITQQRSVLRRGHWALMRARRQEVLDATLLGQALLTRLDTNVWMDSHGR
jgi:hypothetical protein